MTTVEGVEGQLGVSLLRGQEIVVSTLSWQMRSDRTYLIQLNGPSGPLDSSGGDLFHALQGIRLDLESQGWLIAVQGARYAAYASGMVRDMLGASRVYILQMGRQVARGHLVDIFAGAAEDDLGTVEQQRIYFRQWRSSLGR